MGIKKTKEQFIQDAKKVHGDKYDYSKVEYINSKTKVVIRCPEHGEFKQIPNHHLRGRGCPYCGSNKKTTEQFIKQTRKVHGDKYDYSKVEYVNNYTKVIIICPEHGEFEQIPNHHLNGKGCPKCAIESLSLTTEQFITEAKLIHGDKYDYSKVEYVNAHTKVIIICPEHGEFEQIPNNHLNGKGCPKCSSSKGELKIEQYLIEHNISFEPQKKFEECKNIRPLPFDFYLPDYNLCIEYQGEQHYQSVEVFGGDEGLKQRQLNDTIKKNWCSKKENPNLLEIDYTENIEEKLIQYLQLNKEKYDSRNTVL